MMDPKDLELLVNLSSHGRWGAQSLSSVVGLTPGNVERRLKLLSREGVIEGFSAYFDRRMFGYDTTFVKVGFEARRLEKILGEITRMPQIASVQPNMDDFMICEIVHWDSRSLKATMRSIDRVASPNGITEHYVPWFPECVPDRPRDRELSLLLYLVKDGRIQTGSLSELTGIGEDELEGIIMQMERAGQLSIRPIVQEGLINPYPAISLIIVLESPDPDMIIINRIMKLSKMMWFNQIIEEPPGMWLKVFGEDLHTMDDMIERIRRIEGIRDISVVLPEMVVHNRRVDRDIVSKMIERKDHG